jgi:hypothetical protein
MTPSLQPMFDLYVKPYLAIIKLVIVTLFFGTIIGVSFWMGKRFEEGNTIEAENKAALLAEAQKSQLAAIQAFKDANTAWEVIAKEQDKKHDEELVILSKKLDILKTKELKLEKKLKEAYEKDTEWATTAIPTSYGRLLDEASKD